MRYIIPVPLALLLVLAPFFFVWRLAGYAWRLLIYFSRRIGSANRRGGWR